MERVRLQSSEIQHGARSAPGKASTRGDETLEKEGDAQQVRVKTRERSWGSSRWSEAHAWGGRTMVQAPEGGCRAPNPNSSW